MDTPIKLIETAIQMTEESSTKLRPRSHAAQIAKGVIQGYKAAISIIRGHRILSPKTEGAPGTLAPILKNPYKFITRDSISIVGAMYYPQFRMLTITGDGFPMARFVFTEDMSSVFFAFASNWRDNDKLQHMANPDSIPYIFPIEELETHLKKIRI